MNKAEREKTIVNTSIIGIAVNVLLAALKGAIGYATNSIAVTLDAVNNLTDALSSVITIVGTKLAAKAPDKEHPLGYGRIEYLSALIISSIVLYAGITSLVESVKKILYPRIPEYSPMSLALLVVAVIAKILLGLYFKKTGKAVHSGSLIASGSDALSDAILSSSVILSAVIFLTTHVRLEAYVGVIIAVMIIKSAIDLIRDTLDEILGKRPDGELTKKIKATVAEDPEVYGAYDLVLNSYGPDRTLGSIHVEVPDTLTADKIDALERRIAMRVFEKYGVFMTAVSVYAHNTTEDERRVLQDAITDLVTSYEGVLQIHGFFLNSETNTITFDVVIDYDHNPKELYEKIVEEVETSFPQYQFHIALDYDLSD